MYVIHIRAYHPQHVTYCFRTYPVGFLHCVNLFALLGLVSHKYPAVGKMPYQATR